MERLTLNSKGVELSLEASPKGSTVWVREALITSPSFGYPLPGIVVRTDRPVQVVNDSGEIIAILPGRP